jgi:hypothetical protein
MCRELQSLACLQDIEEFASRVVDIRSPFLWCGLQSNMSFDRYCIIGLSYLNNQFAIVDHDLVVSILRGG